MNHTCCCNSIPLIYCKKMCIKQQNQTETKTHFITMFAKTIIFCICIVLLHLC